MVGDVLAEISVGDAEIIRQPSLSRSQLESNGWPRSPRPWFSIVELETSILVRWSCPCTHLRYVTYEFTVAKISKIASQLATKSQIEVW